MAFRYPVALELAGRRCVVVGQGPLAEDKARGLLEAGASVAVIAPSAYRRGDLAGAFLVIAADLVGLTREGRLDEVRDVMRRAVAGAGTRVEAVA